jgi:DNA polymerase III delta prime subunit
MNKILVLGSNPRKDLQLGREIDDLTQAIERRIEQQEHQTYKVVSRSAVRPGDLLDLLREHKPRIVHFCGHGAGEQGLLLQDDRGREQLVSTEALVHTFKYFAQDIECSVFNACTSYIQAEAVVKHIDYAIGMSEEILDRAAYIFAIGFYKAIADGESIERAYEFGCVAIHVQLEHLNTKTSRTQSFRTVRKFEAIDPNQPNVNLEHHKPILRKKDIPSFIPKPNSESSTKPNVPPDFVKAIAEEVERKKYKDVLRDIWNRFGQALPSKRLQPPTKQEYRQRKILLNKVKDFWIEGFLKPSLYADAAINLELKKRPDALLRSFTEIEVLPVELDESFEELQQTDIYDQIGYGKTLLILGEPGSGKTIALLQLAQRLIERTEQDLSQPIPVVFNLSSWAKKRQRIEEWLIEELNEKYQVPKKLSQPWMQQGELVLLLDGLDEVQAKHRNNCVCALNQFIATHEMTEIVVCCRVKDYEALNERLQLSSAICIQPISPKQVYEFLEDVGDSLAGLKTLLKQDTELEKFARTPLILNIMSVTYQRWSAEELLQEFRSPENRYQNLFDAYIETMLRRRGNSAKYPKDKVKRWLGWLATRMVEESQTVFLIEKMQPTWLKSRSERIAYKIINFLALLNVDFSKEIALFEKVSWSWQRAKSTLMQELRLGMVKGLIPALIVGLIVTLISFFNDPINALGYGLLGVVVSGLFFGVMGALIGGLTSGLDTIEVKQRTIPNQGIKSSAKNFTIFVLICGVIFGLIAAIIGLLASTVIALLIIGMFFGMITGRKFGGAACMQHFSLRLILCQKGRIPWNYARFLDYASQRLLMKKVGGGYIFYHRMLMEHFAQAKPQPIAQTAIPVQNYLTCSNCGQENPTNNKFCNKCGKRL